MQANRAMRQLLPDGMSPLPSADGVPDELAQILGDGMRVVGDCLVVRIRCRTLSGQRPCCRYGQDWLRMLCEPLSFEGARELSGRAWARCGVL